MAADKIFVFFLVLFFFGFVFYVAWNSRQNEKKKGADAAAGAEKTEEIHPAPDTAQDSHRPKRKRRTSDV